MTVTISDPLQLALLFIVTVNSIQLFFVYLRIASISRDSNLNSALIYRGLALCLKAVYHRPNNAQDFLFVDKFVELLEKLGDQEAMLGASKLPKDEVKMP